MSLTIALDTFARAAAGLSGPVGYLGVHAPPAGPGKADPDMLGRVWAWAWHARNDAVYHAGPLAGVRWNQHTWYTERHDGARSCCFAGAAVLLAGGRFTQPKLISYRGEKDSRVYGSCELPGSTRVLTVNAAAARVLALSERRRVSLFSPSGTLADLERLAVAVGAGTTRADYLLAW